MVRTTVVGSYPRIGDTNEEQDLRRAIARLDRGEGTEEDVHAAERRTVAAALREQNEAGIDIVTDGQISWYDSVSHLARRFQGIEIGGLVRYFDTNTYYRQPIVHGPVAWTEPILADEWRFAQDRSRAPVKAVLTGPATLAALSLDKHYGKKKALARDLAEALAHEAAALARAGARQIQVDEPVLARHPEDLPSVAEGLDRIAASKGAAELVLFTYFGDAAKVYGDLLESPADVLGFDLVQGARTWSHIAKKGSEKPLVLGLVDARNTKAEDPEAVAAKVRGLRHSVDLGRAYLSPSNGLEFLPREKAREKLRIVAEAARKAEANA